MTEKIKVPARLVRAGVLEARAPTEGDGEDRRVTLTFSSEAPVVRQYILESGEEFAGQEVLGHAEGEVDLSRLASGRAALVTDHSQTIDSQVGVVEKAWIEEGRGRAICRIGKGARASEILERIRDGEITGVSVGYEVTRLSHVGNDDESGRRIIRAQWRPYEITLCPVPADPTVGIGRAADGETQITISLKDEKEGSDMPKDTQTPADNQETRNQPAAVAAAPKSNGDDLRAERARTKEIRALGRKFNVDDEKVDAAIDGETTVAAFQRSILDDMGSETAEVTRSRDAQIGLTDKEIKQFSLMRAVRFLADPTNTRAREAAAFEIEVSDAAQTHLGRDAKGLLVPADILSAQDFTRAQNVGTATAGGNLVATDHQDGSFIGLLRKRAALTRLGVRTLTGLKGNVAIPRQTGGGTAYWIGEGGNPTESESTFNTLNLQPHTLAAAVPITRRAMLQTSPDIEALVRDDLIRIMALEIDRVGINGDADTDAPDGLLDAGISDVDFATAGQPTWAEVVALESKIGADDADVESMRYLFNAMMRGHLKSTPKVAGTAEFMMNGQEVNGYGSVVSNNSPANGMILGNWMDFIIAMWSGLDLTVDTATLAASGGVHLRAFQDVDFGVRHVKSFAYGRDYQP
ncbi:phage major capsid protein [Ruegeria atlantica]|uniref:phage major capsid protein n=1 Tax=Ruegeria atlantica TaxID=81569 RepID=UPI00147CE16A|nr:phage major capsid protein [Ruegeria atlantica]